MDLIHAQIYFALKRNSDRDYYESSLNQGATSTSKQGAIENLGNLLALVCVAKTTAGRTLFESNDIGAHEEDDPVSPLIMLLASVAWFHQDHPHDEVENAKENIKNVMLDVEVFFSRNEGNDWDIPKKHAYMQLCVYMSFYGNALNFYSGFGERSHIEYVKDNAMNTQRQIHSFLQQMAHRVEENSILSVAEHNMIQQYPEEISEMTNNNSLRRLQIELEDYPTINSINSVNPTKIVGSPNGQYSLLIKLNGDTEAIRDHELDTSVQCTIQKELKWKSRDNEKQRNNLGINFDLCLFLAKKALSEGRQEIYVTGFTMVSVQFPSLPNHSIVRCAEDFMGREWYDFVVVKIGENHLPAKVLGFVDYHGDSLFVVRHVPVPSTSMSFYSELKESFTRRFRLGGLDCITMVKVESLIEQLLVFPDFGTESTNDFHALLPKRHWGAYFSHDIKNAKHYKGK